MEMDMGRYGLSELVYNYCTERITANIDVIKNKITMRKVFIFGAGKIGRLSFDILEKNDIHVDGFLDTKTDMDMYCNKKIYHPYQIINDDVYIILAIKDYMKVVNLFPNQFPDNVFIVYDDYTMICTECDMLYKGVKIGRGTYGYQSILNDFPICISIGRYCSINPTARIWNNHPMDYVTTSPILDYLGFFPSENFAVRKKCIKKYGKYFTNHPYENSALRKNEPVIIGNDVWIGANVCILPGVNIGDGAVLAAGAVVNKDVPSYSVVGGVPEKVIKYRFNEDIRKALLEIKWWEWSVDEIEKNIQYLYQPENMIAAWKAGLL